MHYDRACRIYTLYIAPADNIVRGALDLGGHEVANFQFALGTAESLAKDLRKAAANWAEAHQQGNETADKLWRKLHEEGARCFRFVFGNAATAVEKALLDAPPGTELWVKQQDVGLSMPWGLLCMGSDVQLAEKRPLQPALWSAKYNLRIRLRHGTAHQRPQDSWRFEAVVCKKTYATDIKRLPAESAPLALNILARSLKPGTRQSEPQSKPEAPNCFVYVHSHSRLEENDELKLVFEPWDGGDEEQYHPIEIVRQIALEDSGAAVLTILNACESARGFENMGPSLIGQGQNIEIACIATEIPAERDFATEFGLELIDRCVQQGESSYAAMKALRLKHYPLSVIYSHFCKADLTTGTPLQVFDDCDLDAYRAAIKSANYSYRQHGTPL